MTLAYKGITMQFSFKEVLNTGWRTFKKNWKFIIGLGVLTLALQILIEITQQGIAQQSAVLAFILWLAGTLISIIITIGWAKVNLSLVRNHHATWNTFRSNPEEWARFIQVMLWALLYSALYVIATILPFAILGGIGLAIDSMMLQKIALGLGAISLAGVALYITIRFQFYTLAAIDTQEHSTHAIFKKSVALTHGQFWHLLGWLLASSLVILGGVILVGLGLFVAIPVVTIAQTKIYTILKAKHESA